MKKSFLHFGKAISAALFFLLLSVVGMKNALAQNQVATLQHNDSITGVFYGQNAFVLAHNAAANGDIITLSSGTFNNCHITKAVTVRGAGCVYDSVTQVMPTIIPSEFYIKQDNVCFEGIWFTGFVASYQRTTSQPYGTSNNISFVKCNINNTGYWTAENYADAMNWQFVDCIVNGFVSFCVSNGNYCFKGISIINSVVRFSRYRQLDVYNPTTINNSIVVFDDGQYINNIIAYNSIIATVSGHTISNCSFFNCIGIETGEPQLFDGQTTQNVMEVDGYDDVFETFDGTVTYDNVYQLKEEIATSFLGNDGTEVGIFGGIMPYNPRPTYMIMRHCNVAPRSTVDGKLSVDIEIIAEDE